MIFFSMQICKFYYDEVPEHGNNQISLILGESIIWQTVSIKIIIKFN